MRGGTWLARLRGVRAALPCCLCLLACDPAPALPDAAGPDAAPTGQGSEPSAPLVINELAPRGDGDDWIELHNRGTTAIDLCGYFLTDAADRLDHYLPLGGVMPGQTCTPRWLEAGAYALVIADDTPINPDAVDPTRAPFKLDVADEVHLLTLDGEHVDGILFLYPPGPTAPASTTLARVPSGTGLFFLAPPTPGSANPAELP